MSKPFNLLIFLFVSSALAGCATKYQDMGFSGGVTAQQITENSYRIVSRGNGFSDSTTIRDYALLKAAETTKQTGGTHFVVVGNDDASRVDQIVTPGTAQTNFVGNTAYTTYSPAQAIPVFKPGQDVYIRVIDPGQPIPADAISADEIITYVGARVERG
jgi:hypothetical protein